MTLMETEHTTWTKQFINGEWVEGSGEKTVENKNPYTGEVIGTWRSSNKEDIDRAYKAAQKSSVEWKQSLPAVKEGVLRKVSALMVERKEEIIKLLITESGSTRIKAESEFASAKRIVDETASFPYRMKGRFCLQIHPGKRIVLCGNPRELSA